MHLAGDAFLARCPRGHSRALCSALSQTIMEQFNPSLRNFIAMGKNYEKALAGEAPWGPGGGVPPWERAHGRVQALSPDVCLCDDGAGMSCSVARVWGLGSVCPRAPRRGDGVSFRGYRIMV